MSEKKGQNFLHGAAIYTAGMIAIKLLGFLYKYTLTRELSDEGYGYFMVTYNIYNFFLTIATAGLPIALSRMIAEANTLGRQQQVKRVYQVALLTLLVLGGVGTLVMLAFPQQLGIFMGNVKASQGIFIMAPAVVLVCLSAVYRGYAQGHSDMIPTSVSQIIETAVKVAVGLALVFVLMGQGKSEGIVAAGAIAGTTISSLIALLYLVLKVRRKYPFSRSAPAKNDVPDKRSKILGEFLRIGIPITISSAVLSLIALLDTKLIMERLVNAAGYTGEAAEVLYGVYSKTMTLYNLPYYFVIPLTASIMPAISAARIEHRYRNAARIAQDSLRIVTLICLPMAVGMAVLAGPCMTLILNCTASQGPLLMMLMAVASFVMSLAVMTNSILPANGNERLPIYSILAGGAVKVVLNYILIGNPDVNVYGAPIGTIVCYGVITAINLVFIGKKMARPMDLARILFGPGVSAAAMGVAVWAVFSLASSVTDSHLIPFGLAVIVGVVVYFVLAVALRAITLGDMKLIPKGEKIAKLLHIR